MDNEEFWERALWFSLGVAFGGTLMVASILLKSLVT